MTVPWGEIALTLILFVVGASVVIFGFLLYFGKVNQQTVSSVKYNDSNTLHCSVLNGL